MRTYLSGSNLTCILFDQGCDNLFFLFRWDNPISLLVFVSYIPLQHKTPCVDPLLTCVPALRVHWLALVRYFKDDFAIFLEIVSAKNSRERKVTVNGWTFGERKWKNNATNSMSNDRYIYSLLIYSLLIIISIFLLYKSQFHYCVEVRLLAHAFSQDRFILWLMSFLFLPLSLVVDEDSTNIKATGKKRHSKTIVMCISLNLSPYYFIDYYFVRANLMWQLHYLTDFGRFS